MASCASSSELKARRTFAERMAGCHGITVVFYQRMHGDEALRSAQRAIPGYVEEAIKARCTLPVELHELPWVGADLHRLWGPPTAREVAVSHPDWCLIRVFALTYPRSPTALRALHLGASVLSGLGGGSGFRLSERMEFALPTDEPLSFAQRAWPWLGVPQFGEAYWKGTLSDREEGQRQIRKLVDRLWREAQT